MSGTELTAREREYLDCDIPMLGAGKATFKVFTGILASCVQAIVMPSGSYGKADRGLMKTAREIRYTRWKKAVIRKRDGCMKKNDEKLLAKINKKDFVLAPEIYDPDEFTKQVYEEYMKKHNNNEESGMKN